MKRKVSFLFILIALMFSFTITVKALNEEDIIVNDNKLSFTTKHDTLLSANKDIDDFKNYVLNKQGEIISTNISKTINKINTEIFRGMIVVDDYSQIDLEKATIQEEYDNHATDNVKYEVLLGSLTTREKLEKNIQRFEFINSVIKTYDSYNEANIALTEANNSNDEESEDYVVAEHGTRYEVLDYVDTKTIDEMFYSNAAALATERAFKLNRFSGYTVETNIDEVLVPETSTETKKFNSVKEIIAYYQLLKTLGIETKLKLKNLEINPVTVAQAEIDETFNSVSDAVKYMGNLSKDYNKLNLNIKDESYNNVIDEKGVTKTFISESEANDYLDELKSEYKVTNDSIVKDDNEKRNEETISKYFTSYDEANNYLASLQSNEYSLENTSIRKLSIDEIDINDVLNSGDLSLNTEEKSVAIDRPTRVFQDDVTVYYTDDNGSLTSIIGKYYINSIKVNGSYNAGLSVANNSVVEMEGIVCLRSNRLGKCYDERPFKTYGVLNTDNRLTFDYQVNDITVTENGVEVNDNLIDVYKLNTTKVTVTNNPEWIVTADIYKFERIFQFRLQGTVEKINLVPTYTIEFTNTIYVTKYHLTGTASKEFYKYVYPVTYNYYKKPYITEYNQEYIVNQIDLIAEYEASGEGVLPSVNEVVKQTDSIVPKTGVYETEYSIIILVLTLCLLGLNLKYYFRRN